MQQCLVWSRPRKFGAVHGTLHGKIRVAMKPHRSEWGWMGRHIIRGGKLAVQGGSYHCRAIISPGWPNTIMDIQALSTEQACMSVRNQWPIVHKP